MKLPGRAAAVALVCMFALTVTVASAAAETATYSATETIPVPPASDFAGSGGGDGWAVALSSNAVYNVFHHQDILIVACHVQETAEPCVGYPKTITETGTGAGFASQPQPGLYLDQHTGNLYVEATRLTDDTGGVVCIATTSSEPDPFCGFTELTGKGEAPLTTVRGISGMSIPMLIGTHWYSFNFAEGTQTGTKNELTCFDVSTDAACAGQPYAVTIPSGTVSTVGSGNQPTGSTAAIGGKTIIPLLVEGNSWLACFDDATQSSCSGNWPVKLSFGYTARYGAPFPLLDATGRTTGLCLPTGVDQCFNLEGESVATPTKMPEAIPASWEWNGPGLVLGPRVYVPNALTEQVDCFDYSKGQSCENFPKSFSGLTFLYTVNPDPQRPTCIWVNSDSGEHQIQDFDAYTGKACGSGTVRVLASQFVVNAPQCTPANYVSLQVLKPAPGAYTKGVVGFDDGDGNTIPGLEPIQLDGTGTASLAGLELNTATGLPQFLFTLEGEAGPVGNVQVKLTWQGNYDATCAEGGRAVAPTPASAAKPAAATTTPPPAAKAGVAAFGVAHLASHGPACVASNGYVASVSGGLIASVTFTLNGHKVATVRKPNSHGAFTARIRLPVGSKEKLAINVVFTSASKTHSTTIHRTLARCAVVHHVSTPRFTG